MESVKFLTLSREDRLGFSVTCNQALRVVQINDERFFVYSLH